MSALSQNPSPPKFDRANEDRRKENLGSPDGGDRRQSSVDRRTENNLEFVTFYIGDHLLGIPVELVQEVIPLQKVTSIPRAGSDIRGLMNLRGQIVTVVNLRNKLGFERFDSETRMNVIVILNDELLSLEVDSVGDVLPFSKNRILSSPPTLEGLWRDTCQAVVQLEKGLLIILNIQKVFGISEHKKRENQNEVSRQCV